MKLMFVDIFAINFKLYLKIIRKRRIIDRSIDRMQSLKESGTRKTVQALSKS